MCLDVCNRVRNWNKAKNFIYVVSKLQLFQLEIPIFIYKLMCQILLINAVSFLFCEFNNLAIWNEGKTVIATYIMHKILNIFICVEARILVEKWNVYEGHIFQRPLLQTCRLETTSLSLNIRLLVNKKISKFSLFLFNLM